MPQSDTRELFTKDVVHETKQESYVLVLYVGGTIGMIKNADGFYVPVSKTLLYKLRSDKRMHDESFSISRVSDEGSKKNVLVLPEVNKMRRVIYTIYEYEELIDSCNVTSRHWDTIATDIYKNYKMYDGFVILHGTDTLSYTASALSFMLENLGKSVVLTGSQIPMFETRSDGIDNFIGSLIIAGNFTVPEVTVFFHNKLMRGNRTIKFSSNNLDAFASPNAPDIAKLGTEIIVNYNEILYPNNLKKFTIQTLLDEHIGILRIFPNIKLQLVKSFLHSGLKGIVIETYGCGNFTSNRHDLVLELEDAIKRNVLIVNCTQCYTGNVSTNYETGQILSEIGVLSGYDMTSEAALCKLSYVLSKNDWDLNMKKTMLCANLRGEMTSSKLKSKLLKADLFDGIVESLGLSSEEDVTEISETIFPALVINAVNKVDFHQLNKLKILGANFNTPNNDHRTPLHIACCLGNIKLIQYLLRNGSLVHVKDREDKTPLFDAVLNDNHEAILVLRECGAHFGRNIEFIGENLCSAASRGLITRLTSYQLAGVDLNQTDYSGRTPLHASVITYQLETLKFLLNNGASISIRDHVEHTPLDYALLLKNNEIYNLLMNYQQKK